MGHYASLPWSPSHPTSLSSAPPLSSGPSPVPCIFLDFAFCDIPCRHIPIIHIGEKVLLYKSRLRFFAGKLLSKWEGPYIIEEVYRLGAIKIASLKDGTTQVVNGQRLKHYISGDSYNEDIDTIQVVTPEEFIKEEIQKTTESIFE
jgi:hypothetical protein